MMISFLILFYLFFACHSYSNKILWPDEISNPEGPTKTPEYVFVELEKHNRNRGAACKILGENFYTGVSPITELEEKVYLRRAGQTQLIEITDGGYAVLKEYPQFVYCQHFSTRPKFRNIDQTLATRLFQLSLSLSSCSTSIYEFNASIHDLLVGNKRLLYVLSEIHTEIKNGSATIPLKNFNTYIDDFQYSKRSFKPIQNFTTSVNLRYFISEFTSLETQNYFLPQPEKKYVYEAFVAKLRSLERKLDLVLFYLDNYDYIFNSTAYKRGYHDPSFESKFLITTTVTIKKKTPPK